MTLGLSTHLATPSCGGVHAGLEAPMERDTRDNEQPDARQVQGLAALPGADQGTCRMVPTSWLGTICGIGAASTHPVLAHFALSASHELARVRKGDALWPAILQQKTGGGGHAAHGAIAARPDGSCRAARVVEHSSQTAAATLGSLAAPASAHGQHASNAQ